MTSNAERLPGQGLHRIFRVLTMMSAFWGFVTILFGADVTATGSADACPEWPFCTSTTPITFSGQPGIEFVHRVSALVLSLLILSLFLVAVVSERRRPALLRLSVLSLLLVIVQALVGAVVIFTVEQPWVVVLHLALATLLFGLLVILAVLTNLPYLPRSWWPRLGEVEVSPPGDLGRVGLRPGVEQTRSSADSTEQPRGASYVGPP